MTAQSDLINMAKHFANLMPCNTMVLSSTSGLTYRHEIYHTDMEFLSENRQ